jgi:hypothetical protein
LTVEELQTTDVDSSLKQLLGSAVDDALVVALADGSMLEVAVALIEGCEVEDGAAEGVGIGRLAPR